MFQLDTNAKFGCIVLETGMVAPGLPPVVSLGPGVWALRQAPVGLPEHRREWLGSLVADHLKSADLFLVATVPAEQPTINNHENRRLALRVRRYYAGLLIATPGLRVSEARFLGGAVRRQGVDVQETQLLDRVHTPLGTPRGWTIELPHLRHAAVVARGLAAIRALEHREGYGDFARLRRALQACFRMAHSRELDHRLHQAARVIEALTIPPDNQKGTTKIVAARGSIFLGGPDHEAILRMIYILRSKVEHLHGPVAAARVAWDDVADDQDAMIRFAAATHAAETIARSLLVRVLGTRKLWPHFASDEQMRAFWASDRPKVLRGAPMSGSIRAAMLAFDTHAARAEMEDADEDARAEAADALAEGAEDEAA